MSAPLPVYEDELAVLYQGDTLDVLPALIEHGVIERMRGDGFSHVITDPPYDAHTHTKMVMGGRKGLRRVALPVRKRTALTKMDVGFEHVSALDIERVSSLLVQAAKGWALTFCADSQAEQWFAAQVEAGAKRRRLCVWTKTNPMPKLQGDGPGQGTEVFTAVWCGEGRSVWNGGGRSNVWSGPYVHGQKVLHPTMKPDWLADSLVENFTSRADLVIDPFAGSGQFGLAAKRAGRRALLIERDPKYVEIIRARLAETKEQTRFDFAEQRGEQLGLLADEDVRVTYAQYADGLRVAKRAREPRRL